MSNAEWAGRLRHVAWAAGRMTCSLRRAGQMPCPWCFYRAKDQAAAGIPFGPNAEHVSFGTFKGNCFQEPYLDGSVCLDRTASKTTSGSA